jgi:tetratricopeptide (TPR) repeat protein
VPLLAIARGDRLVGLVKLDRGCSSPALTDRRLVFSRATPEEAEAAKAAPEAGTPAATQRGIEATRAGQEHLQGGRFQQAREAFDVALRYDDRNYVALLGLGTAQVKLQEYPAALANLQRALDLARRDGAGAPVLAQAQYDLACVHAQQHRKGEALKAVAQAAALTGPELLEDLEHDPDLEPIRAEPEFRRQVAALRARAARPR